MFVAVNAHDLREVEAFYKRWGPDVFVFCRLFLGDEPEAETASAKAFLEFCRESSELAVAGEIPYRLVSLAYRGMQPCHASPSATPKDGRVESCILCLECKQRAVFINAQRSRNGLGHDGESDRTVSRGSTTALGDRNAQSA